MQKQKHQPLLNEGLRAKDLSDLVSDVFTVDQYKSKMGEDKDVVVLGFRINEKNPATDLMEFIERGYNFILDADMSAGEEHDGKYQVFVEIERTPALPQQLKELLGGIGQVTDIKEWSFKYQKDKRSFSFDEQAVVEHIPTTPSDYESKILEIKNTDVREFFNQGSVDVILDENNNLTFSKPYSGTLQAKFISIGNYDDVKETVPGKLSLDEASQSQMFFLTKYLGNYDINKIENKFLIRNGSKAVVIEKGVW